MVAAAAKDAVFPSTLRPRIDITRRGVRAFVGSVGRVHIHRWGDVSSHFHMWFQGRPAKQLELYGWGNVLWSQVVDPLPSEVIDANHAHVVEHLRTRHGGAIADG